MKRITRVQLISAVLDYSGPMSKSDLPMIRQAINDTADSLRKDGYTVRDFAQDRMVSDIQKELRAK